MEKYLYFKETLGNFSDWLLCPLALPCGSKWANRMSWRRRSLNTEDL